MASNGRSVRLTMPAKAEYITLGRLALSALARVRPLPDETLSDLKLALTEACTNSVRHAYRDGRRGMVEIVYRLEPDRLEVEVKDDGEGFTPENLELEEGGLSEGGLGIAIIRAIVDELEVGKGEGGGSRLRFVKFLQD
ncbi:MAG: ATP-binding protein [Gaiellaceae bacterium]